MDQLNSIEIDDLYNLKFVSDPQLSPDGNRLAYVVKEINDQKKYQSSIYLLNIGTKKPVRWTSGSYMDSYPRWSPDGSSLLFLSSRSGRNQVWLISTEGGEPQQLTDEENGVSNPSWHPEGKSVLYQYTVEKKDKKEPKPIVVDKLKYKADGKAALTSQSYGHISEISLQDRKINRLSEGDHDHLNANFTPDGQAIVFSKFEEDVPGSYRRSSIYYCEVDGTPLRISETDGTYTHPLCSPDGRYIAYVGHDQRYGGATYNEIFIYDREYSTTQCLTEKLDLQVGDMMISDLQAVEPSPDLRWSSNSEVLYFLASEFGNTELYSIDLFGNVDKIVEGDRHIFQYAIDDNRKDVYLALSTPTHPGDLVRHDINSLKEEPLTFHNKSMLDNTMLSVPEPVQFPSQDGLVIHGWILKPHKFKKSNKYPLVLEIHGGPHMMYGNTFFHEFQVLTSKEYAVLYLNPRGSHGYGQNFVNACCGDYGGGDYEDLMAGVDHVLESYEWIDPEQLFVTGGSYGGFMTNWIVGNTNRFKAAVTQRSICNWHSFYGVSDIGYFFTQWEIGAHMEDNPEMLWHHSPIRLVKKIETPLLILHGEKDYRCPIEQAEQLFVALKQQNKTTRFVRFPEADHNLSRSGDPAMRVARLEQILGWFDDYRVSVHSSDMVKTRS
ncbi:S9 family peptidase [Pseudalkalibacillus salsuginis]|uniref:S9 family peptidase n=1 Tax=Pseudalkalibacillus salsuginis TaxID=2910972 RepID=UPI001F1BCAEF|nr:S9 family peptidase [Pseudalkalibacillus salsuginis]MCF6409326.1 S9 family peptidase [Pseudalkalibacillus salsuginis]